MCPTLMQVTKKLYAELRKLGIAPTLDDNRRWHTLFYIFSNTPGTWDYLFHDVRFDWDSDAPVLPELTDILQTFSMVCSTGIHHVDDLIVEYWINEWSSQHNYFKVMVHQMVQLAAELLRQYSSDYVYSNQGVGSFSDVLLN